MHFFKYRFGVALSAVTTLLPNRFRRQLGWVWLSLLLALAWSFAGAFQPALQPALAHRPHDVVTQVKLSPAYDEDQTVYSLVRGNLLKTVDGGQSWKRLVQGLDTLKPFTSLTIDQTEGRLLAMGTQGDGIYLSDDRGETWQRSNQGLDNLDVGLVYSLPSDVKVMLAAGVDSGLSRSTDSGQTWTSVPNISQTFSAFTEAEGTLWAGDDTGDLLNSADGGETWQRLLKVEHDAITALDANSQVIYMGTANKGVFRIDPKTLSITDLNKGLEDLRIQDVKILPGNSRGVMLSSWDRGISISLNSGDAWTDYPQGLIKDKQADEFKTHHFTEIAVSNNFESDQTAFLGGFNGLYKSIKGGQRWQEIETLARGVVVSMDISPNYAEDGTLALNTYVGKTMMSRDQGDTWELTMEGAEVPRLNRSFEPSYQDPRRFFDVAFSPNYATDKTLFSSGLWTKFLRSTNGGKSWSIHGLGTEARGLTLLVSPNFDRDKTLFIGTQEGLLFRSTNGGKKLKKLPQLPWERGNDSPSMVISPSFAEDKTLYMVAATGVYKSTDAGDSWESTTENTPIAGAGNLHIEISSNYPQDKTLYVSSYGGLFKTTDAGDSWQRVAIASAGQFADVDPKRTFLEGVALSPNYAEDDTVVVSLRGKGLYKSTDSGASFTPIGDASLAFSRMYNVPCAGRPIEFSPNYAEDNTIFGFGTASTDIYRSTNGGETWEILEAPDIESPVEVSGTKQLIIALELYRGRIIKVLLAVIAAVMVYFAMGMLRLDKTLKLNRLLLQLGAALATFTIALIMVLKVL